MKNFNLIIVLAIISVISLTSCHNDEKLAQRVKEIKVENMLSQDTTFTIKVVDNRINNITYTKHDDIVMISNDVCFLNGKEAYKQLLHLEGDEIALFDHTNQNTIMSVIGDEYFYSSPNKIQESGFFFKKRLDNIANISKDDLLEMIREKLMHNV